MNQGQREKNSRVRVGITDVPTLLPPSIQVNVRAGEQPPAEENGVAYLRIPVNALPKASR